MILPEFLKHFFPARIKDKIANSKVPDEELQYLLQSEHISVNPIALRTAKTLWSFGHSECNRVKDILSATGLKVF